MGISKIFTVFMTGVSIIFSLAFFGYAANETLEFRENRTVLPTKIGANKEPLTYWEDFQSMSAGVWIDIFGAVNPGMVPAPAAYDRMDQNSLGALKTRTYNINSGLNFDGSF